MTNKVFFQCGLTLPQAWGSGVTTWLLSQVQSWPAFLLTWVTDRSHGFSQPYNKLPLLLCFNSVLACTNLDPLHLNMKFDIKEIVERVSQNNRCFSKFISIWSSLKLQCLLWFDDNLTVNYNCFGFQNICYYYRLSWKQCIHSGHIFIF